MEPLIIDRVGTKNVRICEFHDKRIPEFSSADEGKIFIVDENGRIKLEPIPEEE